MKIPDLGSGQVSFDPNISILVVHIFIWIALRKIGAMSVDMVRSSKDEPVEKMSEEKEIDGR